MAKANSKSVKARKRSNAAKAKHAQPVEHSLIMTATLCLLAFGAVMVYSSSSARTLLSGQGDGTGFLIKYLIFAALGLAAMHLSSRLGLRFLWQITPLLVALAFVLLLVVLIPGVGIQVNGARRWIGPGFLQFQPSEIAKVAIVLYTARLITTEPERLRTIKGIVSPLLVIVGLVCGLIAIEPDLGTALVIASVVCVLLVAGGVSIKNLGKIVGVAALLVGVFALIEPYRRARLTAFLHPWDDPGGAGFQTVQGQIALGSGGILGRGLGQSVQKVFYLPEAHTDFILSVIGEELGVAGIWGLLLLYGTFAFAGLRVALAATQRYAKLVAVGITSLVICQALLNIFVVLGIAPLTGVPLPLISYGGTSLIMTLFSIGLLLNVASGRAAAGRLPVSRDIKAARIEQPIRVIDRRRQNADRFDRTGEYAGSDRSRRDSRTRSTSAGRSRRAA